MKRTSTSGVPEAMAYVLEQEHAAGFLARKKDEADAKDTFLLARMVLQRDAEDGINTYSEGRIREFLRIHAEAYAASQNAAAMEIIEAQAFALQECRITIRAVLISEGRKPEDNVLIGIIDGAVGKLRAFREGGKRPLAQG